MKVLSTRHYTMLLAPPAKKQVALAFTPFVRRAIPSSSTSTEIHAGLPHTAQFIERMALLIDRPLDVTRTKLID
jgi:hypothetical protein